MSEAPPRYGNRPTDPNWSARATIDYGPPKRLTVVIDDAGAVARLPLT